MRRSLVWCLVFMIGVAAASLAAVFATGDRPLLGLDLRGGVSVVLKPDHAASSSALSQSVQIIDRRVNALGVANSDVTKQGQDIVINLPGIKNAQAAISKLGKTAQAFFRPVYCQIPPYQSAAPTSSTTVPAETTPTTAKSAAAALHTASPALSLAAASFPAAGTTPTTTKPAATTVPPTTIVSNSSTSPSGTTVPVTAAPSSADCSASNAAAIPSTTPDQDDPTKTVILTYYTSPGTSARYVLGPSDMSGTGVSNASVVLTSAGQYQVQLNFTSKGSTEFDKIASERYPYYQQDPTNPPPQSLEAFELDGVVYSAPTIQASSFNGSAEISGSTTNPFTSKQASDLAFAMKYGSLPVRFTPQSVQTVSATIGKDSLRAGLLAGIGGIIIVLIYMMVYYRLLGLVVLVGLAIGGAILFGIITLLSQTSSLALTLAGVTGIIVSVGITVDSYVVYFERLKDEIRAGRTVRQSTERSFSRAFRTVLTADFVAFLAAFILYEFTVGDVRGFAFMLGLSTLLDVITAYFFIRPAVILVGRRRAFTDAPIFGVSRGLGARLPAGET